MSDDATPSMFRLVDGLGPLPPQRPGQARTMSRASGDKWDDRAVDLDQCESWHSPDDVLARIAAAVAAERVMVSEILRLRAALNKIAERTSSDDPCCTLVQIARDALRHNAGAKL